MRLTEEERSVLEGAEGDTLRKAMESIVLYGETFGAGRLVPIDHAVHLVTSFGIPMLKPVFAIMDELIAGGVKAKEPFTVDPRPMDFKTVPCGLLERFVFKKIMYGTQADYEKQLLACGLAGIDAFTCTCYLKEVGNIPKQGDMLAWAESSAVVYANSVLGARSNRNSGVIELLCGVLGKAPFFGLLTDEGRKAPWIVERKPTKLPEAQILGSAVGMRVMEDVPYIKGLSAFLGSSITEDVSDYLKDMGAASASNGAVGLFHVDGLTPEARDLGEKLILPGARTYLIDDAEIERVKAGYPVMWKNPEAKPALAFIGCPHLSLNQLKTWTERLEKGLRSSGRKGIIVPAVFTAAPGVVKAFKATELYSRFTATGARLSSICPLMYMNNPLAAKKPVATNSNKLRTYTTARYYTDDEIASIVTGGK